MMSRRTILKSTMLAGGAAALAKTATATATAAPAASAAPAAPGAPRVVVPDGSVLASTVRDHVRICHLVAEPVTHEFAPGLTVAAWGYNGATPGPLIEATVGERLRVYVTNKLPEPTSVHWHGMLLPNGMDGAGGLTQAPIPPGATFRYEFPLVRAGTYLYHPHVDDMTQIALGMTGMVVVHPREPEARRVRDYALLAHEWRVPIGAARPDPLAMTDFNVLTLNGKCYPATEPLLAETGDLVRIRFGNLGPMDHHPLHLHGHAFELVATDGGAVPPSARYPETTVLVPTGSVRVIELVANAPGDWPLHCHMTHHAMNQMGHDAPNLVGVDTTGLDAKLGRVVPGYMTMGATGMADPMRMAQPRNSIPMVGGQGPFGAIDMGGMFTLLKTRDRLAPDSAASWYAHPAGTVAEAATPDELQRDGIEP